MEFNFGCRKQILEAEKAYGRFFNHGMQGKIKEKHFI
jgi:hypothetical protein